MRATSRVAGYLTVLGAALVTAAMHPGLAAATSEPTAAHTSGMSWPAAGAVTVAGDSISVDAAAAAEASRAARSESRPTQRRHVATSATVRSTSHAGAATATPAQRTTPSRARTSYVDGPTSWSALNAAIARIPTYHSGAARWTVSTKYGFWGTADWYRDVLYVNPSVPADKLYDVAVHEWSHELSVLAYDGDVAAATRAMNKTFGGSGLVGAERAADCMSILQGATWTHYTACDDTAWRAAAAKLVAGHQL